MSEKSLQLRDSVVIRREFDDYAILFDPDSNEKFVLNPVGVSICELLDGKRTKSDIIAVLNERFSSISNEVEGEVQEFLDALVSKNFAV